MKTIISSVAALALVALCGCSTTRTVSQMQGRGNKIVYNAPFDSTWRAAVDAAQLSDLRVVDANRDTGYIAAKRGLRPETFGENVGVWVTREGPNQTGVEVVSRQAGPPVLWLKNWEREIHGTIAANLTREAPYAVGAPPAGSGTISGTSTTVPAVPVPAPATVVPTVPAPSTTIVVPAPAPSTVVTRQDAETQIRTLQQQQQARELALQQEQDAQRRAQLQREVDSLKSDLQRMQQRLNQLEREQERIAPAP